MTGISSASCGVASTAPSASGRSSSLSATGPFAQVQRMDEKMIAVLEDAERPDLVEGLMRWLKKVQKAQEATR